MGRNGQDVDTIHREPGLPTAVSASIRRLSTPSTALIDERLRSGSAGPPESHHRVGIDQIA
jgi:hypothetical protein